MDNQLKQRLIGALVVVALAVIFVPELLKESDEPDEPLVNTTIPPSPEPQPANPSTTISLPPAQPAPTAPASLPAVSPPLPAAVEDPLVDEPFGTLSEPPPPPNTTDTTAISAKQSTLQTDSEPSAKGQISAEQAASTQKASAKSAKELFAEEPPAKRQISEERAATPPQPKAHRSNPPSSNTQAPIEQPRKAASPKVALPKVELIGRAGMATAPAKVSMVTASDHDDFAWLVQAGSFSQSQNAKELRDRLRGQGFKAFVEPTTSDTRTFYRVRIGPQSSRTQSEEVLLRLQRLAGINGQVIPLSD